ncbi:MAG: cold shock domain-containing protein [Phycisphaerales bacterium]
MTDDRVVGAEGVVKWFDPRKGFGFIVGPAGADVFAHFSVIAGDGFRALRDGSTVEYDAHRGTDGRWKATRIVRTEQVEVTDNARRHRTPEGQQPPSGYTRSPRR